MLVSPHQIRIMFDAHPLIGKKSGVGYYTAQLVTHMAAAYPDIEFVGYYHNFLLRKPSVRQPAAANIRYIPIAWFPGQIVNLLRRWHIAVPLELMTFCRADFIIYPNYLGPPSMFRTPSAPVIHDLTFVDHPETMSDKNRSDLSRFVPGMISRSSFVITVSEFCKSRMVEHFDLPADRIHVTHCPPPPATPMTQADADTVLREQGITGPFILFVGTVEPRKNLDRLLDAYAAMPAKARRGHSLIIAGKIDWKFAETKKKIADMQAAGHNIKYLGYVDDSTRTALYSRARLFVFPPFYEGFGMPILEAMSYDIPCAISDIPVFHEVAGQAAVYFDPQDTESMAQVIERELSDSQITAEQRQRQLAAFSWDKLCTDLHRRIMAAVKKR